MHFAFVGIPAPSAVFIHGDILERIETKTGEPPVPALVTPVLHAAVPQVNKVAFHEADVRTYCVVKRLGPGQVMSSLPTVEVLNTDRVVEASVGGAQHGAVASANYAGIVKAVLSQEIPSGCPSKTMH